jgi:ribose-phosphate pyrophosphokinase
VKLFCLETARPFASGVAAALGVPLALHEERGFEDGEHKVRPLENVRGQDVYLIQTLAADATASVDDRLMRLLFMLGALRDASAARVTAVLPYLCYARKDRRSKPRDPLATRYVAALIEAMGTDAVLTLDVHNLAAYQNAFRIRADHLEAKWLIVDRLVDRLAGATVTVVSPDIGGVKRAEAFRESLEARLGGSIERAFMEKHRSGGVVSGELFVGEVAGRDAVIVDDLISSGATLRRAAAACRTRGARRVFAVATHGVFTTGADALLSDPLIDTVVVTDSVPPRPLAPPGANRLEVLPCGPLVAEAIRRMHEGGSIADLVERGFPGRDAVD